MNIYVVLGSVLGALLYLPLCYQILQRKTTQNLWTWVMWGILDAIALLSVIFQGGNYLLLAVYVLGSTATSIAIIKSGAKSSWGRFETVIALLAVACMVVWSFSGAKVATIASTLAIVIAALPQMKDAWKRPHENPCLVYVGYTFANLFSAIGGKDWSVEERFYPASCTVLCLVITILIARKFWLLKPALVVD